MCPFCDHVFSRVIATERYDTFTLRRRECRNCLGQFQTEEKYAGMLRQPPGLIHAVKTGNPIPAVSAGLGNSSP